MTLCIFMDGPVILLPCDANLQVCRRTSVANAKLCLVVWFHLLVARGASNHLARDGGLSQSMKPREPLSPHLRPICIFILHPHIPFWHSDVHFIADDREMFLSTFLIQQYIAPTYYDFHDFHMWLWKMLKNIWWFSLFSVLAKGNPRLPTLI